MKKDLAKLENRIDYKFRDPFLLTKALTHSSFAYESQTTDTQDNEVMEFLGDSVLGLVIADFLCMKYTALSEGELSKLKSTVASTTTLYHFAKDLKLPGFIRLGRGEEKSGGRKKRTILAGTFEALIAAVYLDGGIEEATRVITTLLDSFFNQVNVDQFLVNNYKSALQEYFQREKNSHAPVYRTIRTKGPDHKKKFTVEVYAEEKILAQAKGNSIKDAEQKAAQRALRNLLGKKIKSLTSDTFLVKKHKI
ncbi:ribonuclease III [Acidobacteriota bacterium]